MKYDPHPFAHLTLRSDNAKTGPIPVSVTSRDACPTSCPLAANGCYAESGPVALHWKAVTNGERGMGWDMFCDAVATLPPMQLWRHNQAGDLPGDGEYIDEAKLDKLVSANFGKRGFTYTHYSPKVGRNGDLVAMANLRGFTVNLSADTLAEADELYDTGCGPVAVVLDSGQTVNTKTPKGRVVVVCPATQREDVSCATCQLCQRQRETIVGFPAHGSSYKKVNIVARAAST